MKPRIIVCGLDRTGYKILSLLKQQGCFVIGIHDRPIHFNDTEIIIGDLAAAETLLAAGIRDAQTLILAGADETRNLTILMQARVLNPNVRIINRLFNSSLGVRLDLTLPNHLTMSVAALAAPVFALVQWVVRRSGNYGYLIRLGRSMKNISTIIILGLANHSQNFGKIAPEC